MSAENIEKILIWMTKVVCMQYKIIFFSIIVLAICGFFCFAQCAKVYSVEEEMLDDCLEAKPLKFLEMAEEYILEKHPETSSYMSGKTAWKGGRVTPKGLLGHETYQYHKDLWNAKIEWSVVRRPIYKIILNYNSQIFWRGIMNANCKIEETEHIIPTTGGTVGYKLKIGLLV